MKHYLTALVLAGGLVAGQVHAACDYPAKPGKFPDGSQATKDEMLAAKHSVEKYNADVETYLKCLQDEYDAAAAAKPDATPKEKAELSKVHDQKHNAAVEEVTSVTESFNVQLRAWKAKAAADKDKKAG
ncbi:MAG TPA: hypothetical protein VGQ27_01505 [Steroidobacteraceae bacterium]|nr:hypothetical protein [Steroidobacteraceae bacterium]